MSIFGELDVAAAAELKGNTEGTFSGVITAAEIEYGSTNKPDNVTFIVTYTLQGQPFPFDHRHMLPQINGKPAPPSAFPTEPLDAKGMSPRDRAERSLSFLKTYFKNLGIPDEKINSVTPEDLIGIEVVVTLAPQKSNPNYMNATKVVLKGAPGGNGTLPTAAAAPVVAAPAGSNPFAS